LKLKGISGPIIGKNTSIIKLFQKEYLLSGEIRLKIQLKATKPWGIRSPGFYIKL
jgi:hypothetical protein